MVSRDEQDNIRDLFQKYLDGTATPEEQKRVEDFYEIFERRPNVLDQFSDDDINALESRMKQSILRKMEEVEASRTYYLGRTWVKWVAAASIVLLVTSIFVFEFGNRSNTKSLSQQTIIKTDLEPGTDKAVLVLASGQRILLDTAEHGVLATQGAISITMPEEGKLEYKGRSDDEHVLYNEIITPAGGQYKVVLSDGSGVWLNAKSSIRFPASFSDSERNVVMTGEAYFEISKSDVPFKVDVAGKQEVTVLGTHFNINSYDDEINIRTTLLEGSVRVSNSGQRSRTVVLMPGQQSALNAANDIQVRNDVVVEEAVAWKNGYFYYNNSDLRSVLRQMARWYNVEIQYEGEIPQRVFSGKIERKATASEVLEILGFTGVHFRIEKASNKNSFNKIIVTP